VRASVRAVPLYGSVEEPTGSRPDRRRPICYLLGMNDSRLLRLWNAFADWWSFQMGTFEIWLDRTPETPEDRAIREEGERTRNAFPSIDFDHPGARTVRAEPDDR
jgi:hypothetical protein